MFRLLALLQLTRAALAFTAIADAWAILLLRPPGIPAPPLGIVIACLAVLGFASFGLYAFGMALNDVLDARRDRIFAPRRPIPSGRIQPRWAIVTAIVLLIVALLAAAFLTPLHLAYIEHPRAIDFVPWSLLFAVATAGLIVFYDAASKHLGGVGLVTLGAIRALHCLVGNPRTPLLFLSMFLFSHVVIVSTIAYRLENKRPRLKRRDLLTIIFGLIIGNGLALTYMYFRHALIAKNLPMLLGPGAAAIAYVLWAAVIMANRTQSPRQKGERLMLLGLFWLFVYDASILLSNGQGLAALAVTLLLLAAIASFFGLRFLSRTLNAPRLSYRPDRP